MIDVLEVLSGGRLVSLSERELSVDEMMYMHNHPFKRCPDCDGSRFVMATVDADDPAVMFIQAFMPEHMRELAIVAPLPCPLCRATGLAIYLTAN